MRLHLEGSSEIGAERATVFRLLTNAEFISKGLPDAEEVQVLDPETIHAKVKVKLSVVSSSLRLVMKIADKKPPSHAKLLAEGSGSGSKVKIESVFDLDGEGPTTMRWAADADVTGLMAGLGSTVLKGFSEKKVSEIFQGIIQSVEQEAARPGA